MAPSIIWQRSLLEVCMWEKILYPKPRIEWYVPLDPTPYVNITYASSADLYRDGFS